MTYRVKMSCSDCTGTDYMGCGDGEPWYLAPYPPGDIVAFATREEAKDAGAREARKAVPWEYEVEEITPE